ncbi:sugar phosphate isomerase/epimerase family protein [Gilliamella sp. wkB112]|uniref:sugar phosphate isomerase/epimerase family protein n=1 Tax=Gilliamella sp. wkB112 TaxID=3120257 RepID=UPI00080E2A25|nr:sugar phosphate isomerase/epimerase [Gilliamella apicola]OCG01682.1 hypothetical protein A9G12_11925 [Gilliamella apicola]
MKIGMVTDSLSHLEFNEMLTTASKLGIEALEFCTGNWSNSPHIDLDRMLNNREHRNAFISAIKEQGLSIAALNCNGNQLHPIHGKEHDKVVRDTIKLSSLMNLPIVVLMSGLPGGSPTDTTSNWVVTSWPPETQKILEYQWNEVAIPYWKDLADYAKSLNVKLAIELHGAQLAYNVRSFLKLRHHIGDTIGVNLDPSHQIWQGADILTIIRELHGMIYHTHIKDTWINKNICNKNGILDTQPPEFAYNRSWNFITLGIGQNGGEQFWSRFCYELRNAGYDGILSIEQEDVLVNAVEAVDKNVNILKNSMLIGAPTWKPADI